MWGEEFHFLGAFSQVISRQFYLLNDILVYGTIVINKKKFNRQHIIPLEQIKLEDLKDEEGSYFDGLNCRKLISPFI